MLRREGGSQHPAARRSLSVGDISDAFQEEEAAMQRLTPVQKRPMPTPRGDLEVRKGSGDMIGAPNEEAPPLPGAPPGHEPKPGKKIPSDEHLISPYNNNILLSSA